MQNIIQYFNYYKRPTKCQLTKTGMHCLHISMLNDDKLSTDMHSQLPHMYINALYYFHVENVMLCFSQVHKLTKHLWLTSFNIEHLNCALFVLYQASTVCLLHRYIPPLKLYKRTTMDKLMSTLITIKHIPFREVIFTVVLYYEQKILY